MILYGKFILNIGLSFYIYASVIKF